MAWETSYSYLTKIVCQKFHTMSVCVCVVCIYVEQKTKQKQKCKDRHEWN